MGELWSYWWVIFPLMGVLGGAAKAWERGARARHERRIEVIRAKAALKAAQTGAVPAPISPQVAPETTPATADASGSQRAQLARLFAAHDDVTHRWLDYELDVAKLIAYPAMSDGRQPLTAAFLRAKKVADGLRPDSETARVTREQLAEYRSAVTDYEVAFDVAERDARRLRDSSFSAAERKRLDTAKQLLTVAIDQAATPAERQIAYKRVREELDGLISVSDEAIEVLEKKVALELPAGRGDAVPTASADTTTTTTTPTPHAQPGDDHPPAPPERPRIPRSAPPSPETHTPSTAPGRVVRPKPLL